MHARARGAAVELGTTRIEARIVDVVVVRPAPRARGAPWQVLTLRRAPGTRCTGAWELVHGRIEAGEHPADAAVREVREETGLAVERLYSIAVNPFWLVPTDTVQLALVLAAVVDGAPAPALSEEHDAAVWRTPAAAVKVLAWPREHEAVRHTMHLLRSGDAGAVEEVLRVR
ncbi:MAG: NUDIX domain-containing protein [Gemmatimonadetes bacterium]|nr:NUDIX domain-containing protein [Gemmatimonadota bacterium]